MKNYIGSQQHWEDEINADYDERDRRDKEQKDDRVQEDDRQPQQQLEMKDLFGFEESWDLISVLNKLISSTEILLNKKDYDGHGWEEVQHCVKKGKEYVSKMEYFFTNIQTLDSLKK
jgi:hypothetical protein